MQNPKKMSEDHSLHVKKNVKKTYFEVYYFYLCVEVIVFQTHLEYYLLIEGCF